LKRAMRRMNLFTKGCRMIMKERKRKNTVNRHRSNLRGQAIIRGEGKSITSLNGLTTNDGGRITLSKTIAPDTAIPKIATRSSGTGEPIILATTGRQTDITNPTAVASDTTMRTISMGETEAITTTTIPTPRDSITPRTGGYITTITKAEEGMQPFTRDSEVEAQ